MSDSWSPDSHTQVAIDHITKQYESEGMQVNNAVSILVLLCVVKQIAM